MPTKTVFVLGAGASVPYNFPSGNQLVSNIIRSISPTHSRGGIDQFPNKPLADLLLNEFNRNELADFRNALLNSQSYSIDAFLNFRREFIEIGKMCIVWHLMHAEFNAMTGQKLTGDWYQFFWNQINSFKKEKYSFSIYTFNYDRSLDFFLKRSAENYFGFEGVKLDQYLSSIPIYHLHGKLGNMRFGDINSVSSINQLRDAAENIKIIFEVGELGMFNSFQEEVKECKNIVFLGFGYHPDNMVRLGMNSIIFPKQYEIPKIYASCFNLEQTQVDTLLTDYVRSLYAKNNSLLDQYKIVSRLKIGQKDHEIEQFLKSNFPFKQLFH